MPGDRLTFPGQSAVANTGDNLILGVPKTFIHEQQGEDMGIIARTSASSHSHTILLVTVLVNIALIGLIAGTTLLETRRGAIPRSERDGEAAQSETLQSRFDAVDKEFRTKRLLHPRPPQPLTQHASKIPAGVHGL